MIRPLIALIVATVFHAAVHAQQSAISTVGPVAKTFRPAPTEILRPPTPRRHHNSDGYRPTTYRAPVARVSRSTTRRYTLPRTSIHDGQTQRGRAPQMREVSQRPANYDARGYSAGRDPRARLNRGGVAWRGGQQVTGRQAVGREAINRPRRSAPAINGPMTDRLDPKSHQHSPPKRPAPRLRAQTDLRSVS